MKILEFNEPLIRCYPHHAALFATLMTNDFDLYEILPYYLQVVFNNDIDRCDFNFGMDILSYIKNYPYVDKFCYERKSIKRRWKFYSKFIEEMIDGDCYVHFLVDSFFISAYGDWFGKEHIIHNITIYGYDDKYFYVADCFNTGIFSVAKIKKREIDDATIGDTEYDWLDGVHCWRKKEKMYICLFSNPYTIKKILNSYIRGSSTMACTLLENNRRGRINRPFSYGIKIYDEIIKYVKKNEYELDERIPFVLIEHKKIVFNICGILDKQYMLSNSNENIKRIKELQDNSIVLQNLFIKFNLQNKISLKEKIINHIEKMKETEKEVLINLYNSINTKPLFPIENFIDKKYLQEKIEGGGCENWKNSFGTKGVYIVGDRIKMPSEIKIYTISAFYVSILSKGADSRGLERYNSSELICAYYLNGNRFGIEIRVCDSIKITLYCVDYDKLNRAQYIYVCDKKTKEIIKKFYLNKFENGKYLSFNIEADVIISFEKISGPDAVLSGIFFD